MNYLQYTNVFSRGDFVYHRYFDQNGKDQIEKIPAKPYYFLHCDYETDFKDIYGNNVQKIEFNSIKEYRNNRKMMIDAGQDVLGMDNLDILFTREFYPNKIEPNTDLVRIASIDLETVSKNGFPYPNTATEEIDAISHIDSITNEIWLFSTRMWNRSLSTLSPEILQRVKFKYFSTEQEMLLDYLAFWKSNYPNIVTGWNIEGYDIQYMINRYTKLFGENIAKQFSPFGIITSKLAENADANSEYPEKIYTIHGISTLDYMLLYKKFRLTPRTSYRLDSIAEIELNEKKLEYDGQLWQLAEQDPQRYCDYNIQDTLLIEKLENKLKYILLAMSLSYYARINFDKVFSPVTTWDSIIFNSLLDSSKIVPMKKSAHRETFAGAYVKEPEVGKRYGWIASFDLASLYPSIIRQWNISPETIVGNNGTHSIEKYLKKEVQISKEYSQAANGTLYRKDIRGIIPIEIEKVFFQRKQHKNNEFFVKKINEVIDLCIKLYNKLDKNIDLYAFSFIDKTEKEILKIVDSMSKEQMKESYNKIDKDFEILQEYID